jgi:hypothetical protein
MFQHFGLEKLKNKSVWRQRENLTKPYILIIQSFSKLYELDALKKGVASFDI